MEFGEDQSLNTEDHGLFEAIRPESPSAMWYSSDDNATGQLFHPLNATRNPFESTQQVLEDVVMTDSNGFSNPLPHPSTSSQHDDKQSPQLQQQTAVLETGVQSYPEELSALHVTNLQELQPIGKITNIVDKRVIIEVFVDKKNGTATQHLVSQNDVNLKENKIIDSELLRTQIKLNIGAVLFSKDGKAIGKIAEIIGNVYAPYFVLVYPDVQTLRTVFNLPNPSLVHASQNTESGVKESLTTSTPRKEDVEATTPTKKTPSRRTPHKAQTPKKTPSKQFVEDDLDLENAHNMTIIELKPYLQKRGLTVYGKKKELIARLRKYEREKKQQQEEEANDLSSDEDDMSSTSSSDDEELLPTPAKTTTPTSSQKFALRTKKDLEGMESDEEEDEFHKKRATHDKPSSPLDKLSPDEISQIKTNFDVIYCHNVISAPLDEASTMNIVSNHQKSYDAMLNADEKTEIVTFSDDEDENAFKNRAKKERPEKPPVVKRGHEQVSTDETTTDVHPKKQKPLPFVDMEEATTVTTTSIIVTTTSTTTSSTTSEEIIPSSATPSREAETSVQVVEVPPSSTTDPTRVPIVRKARRSAPRKSSHSLSSPNRSVDTVSTTQAEQESFFSKWCSIM
ncbi:hypothetical protein C9374_014178 [Naegleria lovaniensis]|uniref:SAP domain-containing protein n=1 Tax=Naegleria lovaniensis TaxID=51637 RepID=A0AA88KPN4_NAELO|nr:uncharacterized protein C9374_014178 [Naegleria lovaniensis]KAG2389618.1 hypothetical protein C9374_014178 [Naegleria lovaniensis]